MERDGTGRDEGPGLIALLTQLSKSFYRRSTEEMLGMRLQEFLVLSYLRDHLGTTQQELGEAMLLDPNTVVLLLNELESRGYTIRRRDAEDDRRQDCEETENQRACRFTHASTITQRQRPSCPRLRTRRRSDHSLARG